MGPALAAAVGTTDAAGIAKWSLIGKAITDWVAEKGQYASGLVGFVGGASPGAVTGAGLLFFTESPGAILAAAAGSTDASGILEWTAIGAALEAHLAFVMRIAPTALVNSGTGGPITGTATVS